jgi:hypothetical protein
MTLPMGAAGRGRAAETRTSVMAIQVHGRMLGHRVNSEGLRRRAIAPRRAARREAVYSLGVPTLSTVALAKSSLWMTPTARGPGRLVGAGKSRTRIAAQQADRARARLPNSGRPALPARRRRRCTFADASARSAAPFSWPHCGHIPQAFFTFRGVKNVAMQWGQAGKKATVFKTDVFGFGRSCVERAVSLTREGGRGIVPLHDLRRRSAAALHAEAGV